jgi:hypothetical protein
MEQGRSLHERLASATHLAHRRALLMETLFAE